MGNHTDLRSCFPVTYHWTPVTLIFLIQWVKAWMKTPEKDLQPKYCWIPIYRALSTWWAFFPARKGLLKATKASPRQVEKTYFSVGSKTSLTAVQLSWPEASFLRCRGSPASDLRALHTCCKHQLLEQ